MAFTIGTHFFDLTTNLGMWSFLWFIFLRGGEVVLALIIAYVWIMWIRLPRKQNEYIRNIKYTLLAIDVPKLNEQSLRAVEQIFAHLHGIKAGGTKYYRYWLGMRQLPFSLEIVSLGGFTQFLLRIPEFFRDLAEASVYAQYPHATITEVADYCDIDLEQLLVNYDMYGAELVLENKNPYPIRTYPHFEHLLKQIVDPQAALLESMSRLKPGEQCWLQIVAMPAGTEWQVQGANLIKRMTGSESKPDRVIDYLLNLPVRLVREVGRAVVKDEGEGFKQVKSPILNKNLGPLEKLAIEAIASKVSKLGFECRMRLIYFGRKEQYNFARGFKAMIGAIKQYNLAGINGFTTERKFETDAHYILRKQRIYWRQRKIWRRYLRRSMYLPHPRKFILNIEELASIYHFPMIGVMAPTIVKAGAKRGEPPMNLPFGSMAENITNPQEVPISQENLATEVGGTTEIPLVSPSEASTDKKIVEPPGNLPLA